MQNEISWNENTCYEIYNPYIDIPILEPCDTPKIGKYRPKDVQTSRLRNAEKGIRTVKHIGNEYYGGTITYPFFGQRSIRDMVIKEKGD